MSTKSKIAANVKSKFEAVFKTVIEDKEKYVVNPQRDFTRKRIFSLSSMFYFTMQLDKSNINQSLYKFFSSNKNVPSRTAYIKQRSKLKLALFEKLFKETTKLFNNCLKTYKNYRLIAVDGTSISAPYNEDETTFMRNRLDCRGYNTIYATATYDILNGLFTDICFSDDNLCHECKDLITMVKRCQYADKSIFIADRGYETYNNFAHLIENKAKFVIRVKDITSNGIASRFKLPQNGSFDKEVKILYFRHVKDIENLDINSHVIYAKQYQQIAESYLSDENPYKFINLRVVRFKLKTGRYETLVTNLAASEVHFNEMKDLYNLRWGIEVAFRYYKHNIGALYLHSYKKEFQLQEIYAKLILFNLSGIITSLLETKQKQGWKYKYKIKMATAYYIIKDYIIKNSSLIDIDGLLMTDLIAVRPGREAPRNLKEQPAKGFNNR